MLPESLQGRVDYMKYRDQRSFHRTLILESCAGDMGHLKAREFPILALEAELSGLREQLDFMRSEGMLTPAQIEAAENCIAWGDSLLSLLPGEAA